VASTGARPVFRFAPSPNGYLHLGHALSALINADAAGECQGLLLLRIEDIDPARCRPEYETAIYEDLAWLGIGWEEPVRRQSEHLEAYRDVLAKLQEGGLVYPCFCARRAIASSVSRLEERSGEAWPRDPDGAAIYPGSCRDLSPSEAADRLAAGEAHALRLRVAEAGRICGALSWREHVAQDPGSPWHAVPADPLAWGDVILGRRDAPASYHLAVVVDDAAQGVTRVVRGEDLRASTAIHRLLQRLLGFAEPGYHHHRLVRDESGRKLSKSIASTGLRALRARGATPADIRATVGLPDRGSS
jgi:glutamyl-Q tRNA(Asp) synthetase